MHVRSTIHYYTHKNKFKKKKNIHTLRSYRQHRQIKERKKNHLCDTRYILYSYAIIACINIKMRVVGGEKKSQQRVKTRRV